MVNPLTSVDAAETVLFTVIFSLLIYSFFLLWIPIFLAVTFTVTLLFWPAVRPVKSTFAPPSPRLTWSEVRSSISPPVYVTKYLSASNVSNNALDKPTLELLIGILKLPEASVVCSVTCLVISKFDVAKFTVDILSSSILANKPPPSVTMGDPTVIGVRTAADGNPPSHTPVTSCTASTFAVVTPTLSTLLKLSTACPATGYFIISPTFKLEIIFAFGLVTTPLVAICNWSARPKPFNCVFCKTTSAMKSFSNSVLMLSEFW